MYFHNYKSIIFMDWILHILNTPVPNMEKVIFFHARKTHGLIP